MIQPIFYPRAQQALEQNPQLRPFDLVGLTPQFLSEYSDKDAVTQLDSNYRHGGGWNDFNGFEFVDGDEPVLRYPGDPDTLAVAHWKLRDERIILFDHAWVAVVQPDGSFRVARMD